MVRGKKKYAPASLPHGGKSYDGANEQAKPKRVFLGLCKQNCGSAPPQQPVHIGSETLGKAEAEEMVGILNVQEKRGCIWTSNDHELRFQTLSVRRELVHLQTDLSVTHLSRACADDAPSVQTSPALCGQ